MSDFDDDIEYIEAYFKNRLNDAEKTQFEERCVTDEIFARHVALFVTVEEGIRQKLLKEKRQNWPGEISNNKLAADVPFKKPVLARWQTYAVAAGVIFAIVLYFLFGQETPHQLAHKYVNEHLALLSHTMNAANDSLQQGIAAYNNKDYNKALQLFQNIYLAHPDNGIAKKNIGLVYLATKDYDKALREFDELANKQDIYRNPGLFLKAVVLLERDDPGDNATAKLLLEQIVAHNAEGSREARNWLANW